MASPTLGPGPGETICTNQSPSPAFGIKGRPWPGTPKDFGALSLPSSGHDGQEALTINWGPLYLDLAVRRLVATPSLPRSAFMTSNDLFETRKNFIFGEYSGAAHYPDLEFACPPYLNAFHAQNTCVRLSGKYCRGSPPASATFAHLNAIPKHV